MKKATLALIFLGLAGALYSQHMEVKHYNLSSFRKDEKVVNQALEDRSSQQAKMHPEYGVVPYNTQCKECVELIDKRTLTTREYIDVNHPNRTYSQSSYFPLHYKNSLNDIWHTIDKRLRPDATHPGVYTAPNQPVPTKCDLKRRSVSLTESGFEFEFNRNLTAYFFDENTVYTQPQKGNYGLYTVGEEGLFVKDIWPGIDMQQIFNAGEIETNYQIDKPLQLPSNKGFLVIEDHFTLPDGYSFNESPTGQHMPNGYYQGDYILKNEHGDSLITYSVPKYIDTRAFGMHGFYKLIKNGNNYTLQMMVPASWLSSPDNVYPIVIDPLVLGVSKLGNFRFTNLSSASLGFTTISLGSCNTGLAVTVPGQSELKDAYVDVEYELTYDNTCGNPPLPSPYCTFSQATMEVTSNECNTTSGLLTCNPAQPPFTGTCTTDPNLVPGAHAILINSFVPNYIACLPPQCPDYNLHFTLKNRDSICGDVCGYLCARGNIFQMSIYACTVEGTITQDHTQVCAGQPVVFTAHPDCGVPPYHFQWSSDGGSTFNPTVYGDSTFTLHPNQDVNVVCHIFDSCGKEYDVPNFLTVTVIAAPPADAGPEPVYLCSGGVINLGGSPTTDNTATVVWTGSSPTETSWLNSTTSRNPQATVPAGVVDTFFYVVTATNPSCFRTDTVHVFSIPDPQVTIDSSGSTRICTSQKVRISAPTGYANYSWNNGGTSNFIDVNRAGNYYVVVTDQHGCKDTSNIIQVTNIGVPSVTVFPDTTIHLGDSLSLGTDIDLSMSSVDSFAWYPDTTISCIKCFNPVVSPLSDQHYGIVVYSGGCSVTDSVLIQVILPNNYYIPNAFTPNHDGNNDDFYIKTQMGVKVELFQVYNRIGEKVHDGLFPWDGNFHGAPAPPGVYVYIVKLVQYGNDKGILHKGSVTLFR